MVRGIRWMRERLLTGGEAARQESRWVWDRGSSGLRAGIKKCCGLNREVVVGSTFAADGGYGEDEVPYSIFLVYAATQIGRAHV